MPVIAPTVAPAAELIPDDQIPDDPFHDARLKYVGLLLLLSILAGPVVLCAIFLGSSYGSPSWSAASVPPPIVQKVK
jgi:hypothetical protein